MKSLKMSIFTIIAILFALNSFSQFSISYYNSSMSKVGVAYDFDSKLWTELRLYGNTWSQNITPEAVLCYNLKETENHNIYIGLGANVNYFSGVVLPVGVQFSPFGNFDKFSLHIEIQPTFDISNDLILQSSWGLRYRFGSKLK